jgi:hypothetical protein
MSSSYSLDEVPPQVQFFLFISAMTQVDWPITQNKETMEAPQNRRFYFET